MSDHRVTLTNVEGDPALHVRVRDLDLYLDSPEERGGTNKGPSSREYFLMAVGGCFLKNLRAAIAARDADVHDIEVEAIGTQAEAPRRIAHVELVITAHYSDEAQMHHLVEIADRGCLIANTVRGAVEMSHTVRQRVVG